ncbi:hypothetical protein F5Y03DRAFT_376850 [Xylaria venustula]|nr:hypothetical protein F5Y03DRAFT_376850 [Xylaria venustula]
MAGIVKHQRQNSQEADDESASAERKKKKNSRSRNGCMTCRARKIKCDETPENCLNCERIHAVCPGYGNIQINRRELSQLQSQSSDDLTEAGIKRSRSLVSCEGCRRAKTKCVRDGQACTRCLQKNVPCVMEASDPDSPIWNESNLQQTPMIHQNYPDSNTSRPSLNFHDTETVNHFPDTIPSDCPPSWIPSPEVVDEARVPKLKWTFTLSRPNPSDD